MVSNTNQLKMKSSDGKYYNTDTLDTKGLFRLIESEHPQGFKENMKVARIGGQVANDARKSYEKATKKSAISNQNALNYKYIDDKNHIENK